MSASKIRPGAAIAILVVCAAIAAKSLFGSYAPHASAPDAGEAEAPAAEAADADATPGSDLLAKHGSFDRSTDVYCAFAAVAEVAVSQPTPAGETKPVATSGWRGEEPPRLRLSVVMLGDACHRAVFGGQIVAPGDAIAQGNVADIVPGALTLLWKGRSLTYDLGADVPREFRAELARRQGTPSDSKEQRQ